MLLTKIWFVPLPLMNFSVSCFTKLILKCDSEVSELHVDQDIFGGQSNTRHIPFVRPRLDSDTRMQPTSLSWAFDLLHYMSRAFRGQIARHKLVLLPCSLIQHIFTFSCLFFFFCLFRWKMSARLWPPTHFLKCEPSQLLWMNENSRCWLYLPQSRARVGYVAFFWGLIVVLTNSL